jgi:EAL and modified HD-GYP domain-containing signal transduction protein
MPSEAALAMPEPGTVSDDFFLARQPILSRDQLLVAFELLFRNGGNKATAEVTDDASATASVISHAATLGMEQVVGTSLAFVNVDAVVLMSDFIRFLPNNRVILEILETVKATPPVVARMQELKALGFKFALDDVISQSPDVAILMPLVDVIKIDLMGVAAGDLPALVRSLKTPGKKLLAEKVETLEQFHVCMELGFEYFQGYYFARPVILTGKKIAPSQLAIINLLELINSDAETKEIELAVKHDALISLNLLRLVNSAASGARNRIDSLGQALMMLGRRQLQRWLQILLYTKPGGAVEFNSPLLQLATTRGKLMELLMLELKPKEKARADVAFTVGIMSLMDTLFSIAMQEILGTVIVTDEVSDALLDRKGEFGAMLNLVEMLENPHKGPDIKASLEQLDLSVAQLRDIQMAAFEWVNNLAVEGV